MSKRTILKNAMSKKYCDSTYFDYLDKEELPLIYKAMSLFAAEKTHELLKMVVKLKEICESEIPEFNIPELNAIIDDDVS